MSSDNVLNTRFEQLPDAVACLQQRLQAGAAELKVNLDDNQQWQLLHYLVLLQKWNGAYNLTAVKDLDDMLRLHLLDSLSIAPLLDKTTYIDVGTGAGLPGLPLAIVCPDKHFTLLDTNSKRTRFMLQAKSDLGLTNITVVKARVEDYTGEADFDGVLSRAFASLIDMLKGCQHLLGPGGLFLAMKGLEPTAEYEQIPDYASLKKVYSLHVPEVNAERHLIVLEKRC